MNIYQIMLSTLYPKSERGRCVLSALYNLSIKYCYTHTPAALSSDELRSSLMSKQVAIINTDSRHSEHVGVHPSFSLFSPNWKCHHCMCATTAENMIQCDYCDKWYH